MEEKEILQVTESQLAELLEAVPDNVVVTVSFREEEKDGERD